MKALADPNPRPARAWRHAPPVQARAQQTLEAFARATEDLLRDRPFEALSVQDIVRRARRPIGSFYARFASKDALLPYLYKRYHEGLGADLDARFADVEWARLSFGETVEAIVDLFVAAYEERRWLLRALALFARRSPEALPADVVERRRRSYDEAARILARHRAHITHDDPEAAARFGIFLISSVAREKLLFEHAPLSRLTPVSREALRANLVRSLAGFLAGAPLETPARSSRIRGGARRPSNRRRSVS